MGFRRALATFTAWIALALPQAGIGMTDPARGFDNPEPEAVQVAVQPAPQAQAHRAEPAMNAVAPSRAEFGRLPARDSPESSSPALPFVSVLPSTTTSVYGPRPRPVVPSPSSPFPAANPDRDLSSYASSFQPFVQPETAESSFWISRAEVEKAVAMNATLDTPFTAQVDALEASRRSQRPARGYNPTRSQFFIQAALPDSSSAPVAIERFGTAYFAWTGAFIALAAMLLYVGWRVIRLVLATDSPRERAGAG